MAGIAGVGALLGEVAWGVVVLVALVAGAAVKVAAAIVVLALGAYAWITPL
jgi:hypothetical protein